jgi:hypothetical protein
MRRGEIRPTPMSAAPIGDCIASFVASLGAVGLPVAAIVIGPRHSPSRFLSSLRVSIAFALGEHDLESLAHVRVLEDLFRQIAPVYTLPALSLTADMKRCLARVSSSGDSDFTRFGEFIRRHRQRALSEIHDFADPRVARIDPDRAFAYAGLAASTSPRICFRIPFVVCADVREKLDPLSAPPWIT